MGSYLDQDKWYWEHPGMDRIGPFDTQIDADEDYLRYLALYETHNNPFKIAQECRKLAQFQRLAADYHELATAAESVLHRIRELFRIEGIAWQVRGDWRVLPVHVERDDNEYL